MQIQLNSTAVPLNVEVNGKTIKATIDLKDANVFWARDHILNFQREIDAMPDEDNKEDLQRIADGVIEFMQRMIGEKDAKAICKAVNGNAEAWEVATLYMDLWRAMVNPVFERLGVKKQNRLDHYLNDAQSVAD